MQCGSCRLQSELRFIRLSWVARRRCRLLSAKYWALLLKKVFRQYQYRQVLANTRYPNTCIVQTLIYSDATFQLNTTVSFLMIMKISDHSSLTCFVIFEIPGLASPV